MVQTLMPYRQTGVTGRPLRPLWLKNVFTCLIAVYLLYDVRVPVCRLNRFLSCIYLLIHSFIPAVISIVDKCSCYPKVAT